MKRSRWAWWLLVAVLGVAVVGSAQTPMLPFLEDFEDNAPDWEFGGWPPPPDGVMWNVVAAADLFGEPAPVQAFPTPGTKAAYFGNVSGGVGSYDTGWWVGGPLISPRVLLGGEDLIQVNFWYYREVESYAGEFDRTWAEVRFVDGDGHPVGSLITIFDKDSSDPLEGAWTQFASDAIHVPGGAATVQVVFNFDSVDAWSNDHLGWLVDNVEIVAAAAPLEITTMSLRPGRVGWWYWQLLEGTGGTPPYSWMVRGLPERLMVDRGGVIQGIPTVDGTFEVTVTLRDQGRGSVSETFVLVIEPEPGVWMRLFSECFDEVRTPLFPPGWAVSPGALWHTSDTVPGAWNTVAYFGRPGHFNYDTGARTEGHLTTPPVDVTELAGQRLWVEFSHWREVEHFTGGAFDKTWVEVSFDGTTWTRVWGKDSRDVSEREWRWVEVDTGLVIPAPVGGQTRVWVRFCFDSVDSHANHYRGWMIDCVGIGAPSRELTIVTPCPLPAGEVEVPYEVTLRATGGCVPYLWEVTGLPSGLVFDRATGVISGTPRTAGTFDLGISVTDGCGTTRRLTCQLVIGRRVTLFVEPFTDLDQWLSPEALWHRTSAVMHQGQDLIPADREPAAYFGRKGKWHYDTGWRVTGALTSEPFALDGAAHIKVAFDHWREVEFYAGAYDRTVVQVRFGAGPWLNVWYRDSSDPSERAWTSFASPGITVPAGATAMQIRFLFDSVDRFNNRFVGWLVDNVRVSKAESGSPLAALALPAAAPRDVISVFNYPNPIRDVHTTTFAVRGVEAEAMRVEIFDLAGRLVYRAEGPGNELVWHTQDLTGLPLANGVYLYKVYVRVGGVWVTTQIQRLVILR